MQCKYPIYCAITSALSAHLNQAFLLTVSENVIKPDPEALKIAAHPAPAASSVKKESAGSSTPATSPPRARGRPRKTKPGSLQPKHLKSPAKDLASEQPPIETKPQPPLQVYAQSQPQMLIQPQSQPQPQSQFQPLNGFLEPEGSPLSLGQSQHDLSQSAFLSWLSQTQNHGSLLSSSVLTPDSSPGKLDPIPSQPLEEPEPDETESNPDAQASWFSFSDHMPCNAAPTPPPAVSEDRTTPPPQLPASSKSVSCQN